MTVAGHLKRSLFVEERGRGHAARGTILSFENDKHIERRRKSVQASDTRNAKEQSSRKRKSAGSPELGSALRSVYQRTINEDIPPDLLDLLGKLG